MSSHKEMYLKMFNAATDALRQMEKLNFGTAKAILEQAQVDCERLYIEAGEEETVSMTSVIAKNDEKQGSAR